MNGKKIALLTMLIVFAVLLIFTVIFAKFILNIDFGGKDTSSHMVSEELSQENSDKDTDKPQEDKLEDPIASDKDTDKDKEKENKKDEKNKEDKNKEDNKEEEKENYKPSSEIKSADIVIKDDNQYQVKVEDAEKLTLLLKEIEALQLTSIQQSVGMQDANWQATLNLSMKDGTAVDCHLYESTLSGTKTTLSNGSKTFESTASIEKIKKLLQGFAEEAKKANAPKIAQNEFSEATRVLAINPFTMEVQDVAQSKSSLQAALEQLQVVETYTGNVNPGSEYQGTNMINLANDSSTLFTIEFYKNGILAYRTENSKEFYVCELNSLNAFYQTVEQLCSKYSAQPAQLSVMDFGALSGMEVSSTTGSSRTEVGLIRDHSQTLFTFLQQLHVKKGSLREEKAMLKRPEYHAEITFNSGMVITVDISKGSLLIQGGDGVIRHYTLIGDDNLELVRAEFERVTSDD